MSTNAKEIVVVGGSGIGCLLLFVALLSWLVFLPVVVILYLGGWLS